MKCEELDRVMIDYLDNALDRAYCDEIEKHLASCERCMDEIREFKAIFQSISETGMEQPDEILRINFNHMLQSEINKLKTDRELTVKNNTKKLWPSVLLKIAAGIALLILGDFLGNIIHQNAKTRKPSAQVQVDENNNNIIILLYTLLNEESPGKRIKAINFVEDSISPDTKVLNALISVLNNDNNVNVRLAAAYTLSKYSDKPWVRDSIVESLGKQTEPLIQIALINILTEKMETKAVEPMKRIISDKNTIEQVKYAAEKSINLLL